MPLLEYFEFQARTKIIFGAGTLNQVGKEASELKGKRALIIADEFIVKLGHVNKIINTLENTGIEVIETFDKIPPNTGVKVVNNCYNMTKDKNVDVIITIGGGSVIDTAKGVNILLSEGGDLLKDHQGTYLLSRPLKPMVAIPTTAGTGSEVTFAAIIKDEEQKVKLSFISPFLAPNTAILDPELTLSLPKELTASTGMDALTHAIESIHSNMNEPISDAFALHSIKLIVTNLKKCIENGNNIEARGNMLIASTIAGFAFTNALVGVVHGISHACGGVCNVPHGVANSILLPHGMEYNIDYCPERYSLVASAMGIDIQNKTPEEASKLAINFIKEFTRDLGLPQKLSEVGVKEEDIPKIAETTMGDGSIYNNPREVIQEEVEEILKKAL